MAPNLGRLERVALWEIWPHESSDLTPWVAQDDNPALLGDAVGLQHVLEMREQEVEHFKADILAKSVSTDHFEMARIAEPQILPDYGEPICRSDTTCRLACSACQAARATGGVLSHLSPASAASGGVGTCRIR